MTAILLSHGWAGSACDIIEYHVFKIFGFRTRRHRYNETQATQQNLQQQQPQSSTDNKGVLCSHRLLHCTVRRSQESSKVNVVINECNII